MSKLSTPLLAALIAFGAHAYAADLRIGLGVEITTLDPHFQNIGPNVNLAMHIYDALVNVDRDKGQIKPGLAESWRAVDDLTWEFKLRKGVRFHDGSEVTAEDVIFSFDRPATLTASSSPYTAFTRFIVDKKAVDKYTVRFKTAQPYAMTPIEVTNIFIVPKKLASMTTDDYNSGKAVIGTGPYKFVRWSRGDRVELARNEDYWGGKTPWDKVTLRIMITPAARVAALLAGDVDAIEGVPPADYTKLKSNPAVGVYGTTANRMVFLQLDQARDVTPYITGKDGKPLPKNPLKDARVRRALSMAIPRQAIAERVLEGNGYPAGQFMPAGFYGYDKDIKVEKYDPEGAKKLLAEAGYKDGFNLVLHGPSGRYVNDEKVLQTIAQGFSRIGVATKVDASPVAVYFSRLNKLDASVMMYGWGGGTGHISNYFKSILNTYDAPKGNGIGNYGRYANPKIDALTEQGYATIDTVKQEAIWRQASQIAFGDQALIPLHHQMNVWAAKKGVKYHPRTDERTLAWEFTPDK